jgi:hypothetical protein
MSNHRYTDEEVAQVCHEAVRALQDIQNDPAPSQPWWAESSHTRQSAVDGVRAVRQGSTQRALHQNWMEFKSAAGWVYGKKKDPEAKTHPCMVPYDELPQGQRDKDVLFHALVSALTI